MQSLKFVAKNPGNDKFNHVFGNGDTNQHVNHISGVAQKVTFHLLKNG